MTERKEHPRSRSYKANQDMKWRCRSRRSVRCEERLSAGCKRSELEQPVGFRAGVREDRRSSRTEVGASGVDNIFHQAAIVPGSQESHPQHDRLFRGITLSVGRSSKTPIPPVRLFYRHYGEDMNFFLCLIDAIERREGMAYVKTICILPSLNIQAFLIAPAAGERIFLKRLQLLHDDPPALRAETLDTFKGLAINQYPERQRSAPRNPLLPRCDPCLR